MQVKQQFKKKLLVKLRNEVRNGITNCPWLLQCLVTIFPLTLCPPPPRTFLPSLILFLSHNQNIMTKTLNQLCI